MSIKKFVLSLFASVAITAGVVSVWGEDIYCLLTGKSTTTTQSTNIDYVDLVDHMQKSTVVVFSPDSSFGTGFTIMTPEASYVITAAHVISGARNEDGTYETVKIGRIIYDGDGAIHIRDICDAKVVRFSNDVNGHDIALLRLADQSFARGSVKFAEATPRLGTAVMTCGTPVTPLYAYTVGEGIVSGTDRFIPSAGKTFFQVSTPVAAGSSGSAVFDRKTGAVIGIICRAAGETFSFAVPVERIHQWAMENNCEFVLDTTLTPSIAEIDSHPIESVKAP